MSEADITAVIRRHTGPNATDDPIPHADVEDMIAAARADGRTSVAERLALLSALAMWGPEDDLGHAQLSDADRQALVAAVLHGIETYDGFRQLGKEDQARFLEQMSINGELVGITCTAAEIPYLPDAIAAGLDEVWRSVGKRPLAEAQSQLMLVSKGEEVWGALLDATWDDSRRPGYSEQLRADVNADGEVLRRTVQAIAPDPPESGAG